MAVNKIDGSKLSVTIPVPSHIPRARGIHSTMQYGGVIHVRMHNSEKKLIKTEAFKLGLSSAGFVRWCAVYIAKAMEKSYDSDDRDSTR